MNVKIIDDQQTVELVTSLFFDAPKLGEILSASQVKEFTGAVSETAPIVLMVQAFYLGIRYAQNILQDVSAHCDEIDPPSNEIKLEQAGGHVV